MRFMAMIKATRDYEAGKPPNPELMAAMGEFQTQLGAQAKAKGAALRASMERA